uniref:Uncharacterized protein n=1 Tax=Rhizophora mucronata TaxID=61149 RepID=A0A2P2NE64_RHIMU
MVTIPRVSKHKSLALHV